MRDVIERSGIEPVVSSPEEFAKFLAEDYAANAEILPSIGVKSR